MITLNEEENLPRVLQSCRDLVDEIVIVDSGSSDRTKEIAGRFGALWHDQPWLGYVGQKNKALGLATHEWILSLDADEELSPELRSELAALKAQPLDSSFAGYSMPRCVLYEGQWIRHGDWYPDRLTRLFRRGSAHFEGGKVHERLVVKGAIQALTGEIYHHSFRDAADHWARCQKYARLWAESRRDEGRRAGPIAPWSRSAFRFFRAYFLKRGFLDGKLGLRIAAYSAREVFLKYQTLRNLGGK